MRILITGVGKSGTTALFCALQQTLPPAYTCLFEPPRYTPAAAGPCVLAKVLINEQAKVDEFDCFDRKIFLVRDPRDNIVSRLLYAIYDSEFVTDDRKVRAFVERLEQKRRDPPSVAVVELFQLLNELSGHDVLGLFMRRHRMSLDFDTAGRGYFTYKYEDFIAGRYSGLEEYLGLGLRFSGEVDAPYRRVVRTRGSGDWRNWFTGRDVEYFRPAYREYLVRYGYDPAWAPHPAPEILPEHSTEYVGRLVREARAARAHGNRSLTRRIVGAIERRLRRRLARENVRR